MKTLNSGAFMGLDLIRRMGIIYMSVEDRFYFKVGTFWKTTLE
jgi:hypothetical protein